MAKPLVLVTGASGFIGKALCPALIKSGFAVRAILRKKTEELPQECETVFIQDIAEHTQWNNELKGVEAVIHLAGRAHIMREDCANPNLEYNRINVLGTARLALSAASCGVRRFIYISSIKVNGESNNGKAFTEKTPVNPEDAYALSKWKAENILHQISKEHGLEIVIIRLPLVYGPGVKGNFLRLIRLIEKGIPLPFKSISNQRSLIYLDNLIAMLLLCIRHPKAANETFLVSDAQDVSTVQLVGYIAKALKRPSRLFSVSRQLLCIIAKVFNKSKEVDRLINSLVVDTQKIQDLLLWKPVSDIKPAIEKTVQWYLNIPKNNQ